ncbi:unnamed protein product [Linum trigynum]|uniref:Uncharacterized protein n=1 Tax=Linum trigynum TaxID=586398 RepID=A0AAV2C959_9ROSI
MSRGISGQLITGSENPDRSTEPLRDRHYGDDDIEKQSLSSAFVFLFVRFNSGSAPSQAGGGEEELGVSVFVNWAYCVSAHTASHPSAVAAAAVSAASDPDRDNGSAHVLGFYS